MTPRMILDGRMVIVATPPPPGSVQHETSSETVAAGTTPRPEAHARERVLDTTKHLSDDPSASRRRRMTDARDHGARW